MNSWPRLGEAEPGLEGHTPGPLPAGAGPCAMLLRDGLLLTYWLSSLTPGDGPRGDFKMPDIPKGRGEGGLGWGQT